MKKVLSIAPIFFFAAQQAQAFYCGYNNCAPRPANSWCDASESNCLQCNGKVCYPGDEPPPVFCALGSDCKNGNTNPWCHNSAQNCKDCNGYACPISENEPDPTDDPVVDDPVDDPIDDPVNPVVDEPAGKIYCSTAQGGCFAEWSKHQNPWCSLSQENCIQCSGYPCEQGRDDRNLDFFCSKNHCIDNIAIRDPDENGDSYYYCDYNEAYCDKCTGDRCYYSIGYNPDFYCTYIDGECDGTRMNNEKETDWCQQAREHCSGACQGKVCPKE